MLSLLFRPAHMEDESFLLELYASVRQREIMTWGWPHDQQQSFLRMQYFAQRSSHRAHVPNATQIIVMLDETLIGQYAVDYTSAYLHLIDISISPKFHNKGIGTSILQNLQQESIRRHTPIILNVIQGNPASRLYERLGFVCTGTTDMYKSMKWLPPNNIPHGKGQAHE